MVGEISSVLEILVSVLFGIGDRIDKQKHRDIGLELHAFYKQVLDIIWNAENIYGRIRHISLAYRDSRLDEAYVEIDELRSLLHQQSTQLLWAGRRLYNISNYLRLVNPSAYNRLGQIFVVKGEIINDLYAPAYKHVLPEDNILYVNRIESYLAKNPPDNRIASMKESAEAIREYIIEHWELSELF